MTYYNRARYGVYLHKNPSRTSEYYLEIPGGTAVKFLELEGEFYKVRCNLFTGYVLSKYFSKSPDADYVYDEEYLRPMICIDDVYIYDSPDYASMAFELNMDDEVTVVGYLSNEQFYEIVYQDMLLYVPKDDLDAYFADTVE